MNWGGTQGSLVDWAKFGRDPLENLGGGGLAKVKWKHQVPYYTECIFNCVGCIA